MNAPNYGIQQSGGQSTVGNQAVGPNARVVSGDVQVASQFSDPAGRTTELLDRVSELLDAHHEQLPGTTIATAEILRDELGQAKPDRGVVGRLLEKLTELVRPVAPLLSTVTELTKAVDSAFTG
ncbi:hypothetical protein [Amycolatopsis nigrescens]|uniref:hypothetical protein n=1 Tax=Amycolatopsis nigrescens TaxID=381445 RepID=UPI000368246F|nr:hypothetical protein [Amycolatopsis nigrescens]